ncbi:MAG: DUF2089 family protein [Planctomycetota bacterium]
MDTQRTPNRTQSSDHPLAMLPRDDLDIILQFVLVSGSLKAVAKHYGVSYPTIRTRLDAVIARLLAAVEGRRASPLGELLAQLVERGELNGSQARQILDAAKATHAEHNGEQP